MPAAEWPGQIGRGMPLSAFGLAVESDFALPAAHTDGRPMPPKRIRLTLVERAELEPLVREPRVLRWAYAFDDCPYAMLEGAEGDLLLFYGHRALFHLSADFGTLRCAPADLGDPTWQRVLLDTVLWTVAVLRGYELLHASAVLTEAGVVAFLADMSGGKTSIAAEHLRRGGALFCDDILALDDAGGQVVASPGPPVMNLPRHLVGAVGGDAAVIGDFGHEAWVRVETPSLAPQPPAALVLLERTGTHTGAASCIPVDATSLTLLPHLVRFPDVPERARRRFEVSGAVVGTTPVLRLTAEPSVPTAALADLVEEELARL